VWLQKRWVVVYCDIKTSLSSNACISNVNFAASLSLAKILRRKYGLDVSVKWPNDIRDKESENNKRSK
jgi:biotin-(acetyl-CoA carboxylase) ligase